MRINWNYIKMIVVFGLLIFLYVFASVRSVARPISKPQVSFVGNNNLFITPETVSKLLIQNQRGLTGASKDVLDLNILESALNSNSTIKDAQVYLTVNGTLNVDVEQKQPIARVSTNASYYIDSQGTFMPLSSNYTARVPMVTGYVEKNKLQTIFKIADKVYNDDFLRKHVVEIHQNQDWTIGLKLRQCPFSVQLGTLNQLDKKINNLKAFYQKAYKEQTLKTYSKINLQFDNQVVCTKR